MTKVRPSAMIATELMERSTEMMTSMFRKALLIM
jgi:hypothetical protein